MLVSRNPSKPDDLKQILDFNKLFDKLAVDILELSRTNFGNKYAVIFSDLTKWVESFPIKDMKEETIAKLVINEIVCRHSAPLELISDQGANFMSNEISII